MSRKLNDCLYMVTSGLTECSKGDTLRRKHRVFRFLSGTGMEPSFYIHLRASCYIKEVAFKTLRNPFLFFFFLLVGG